MDINAGLHSIDTGCARPIAKASYRHWHKVEEEVCKEVEKLLKAGVIRKSKRTWRSRIVTKYKKNAEFRLCIDYRSLNEVKKESIHYSRNEDILDFLGNVYITRFLTGTQVTIK